HYYTRTLYSSLVYSLPITQKFLQGPNGAVWANMAEASAATPIHVMPVIPVYRSGGACLRHAHPTSLSWMFAKNVGNGKTIYAMPVMRI
ncbi:MAG TPA: hypothetical protein VK140_07160, partial [Ktedonobacteraceae bacterium]|nr:hypothetical protein [Ktedonobacteraceae bacterium]